MRVDQIRLEASAGSDGGNEVGAEETYEGEARTPRSRDILCHVSSVGKLLVASGCITKTLDGYPIELFH
jgi:hypothetical protein